MQRASQELSCTTLLSWPFSQSKALRMMVITFQLLNQPYTLSINFPPMFPSPRYHCCCVAAQLASLIATPFLQASPSQCMLTFHWHCTCKQCCAHRKYACTLLTYIHTYIHTNAESVFYTNLLLWRNAAHKNNNKYLAVNILACNSLGQRLQIQQQFKWFDQQQTSEHSNGVANPYIMFLMSTKVDIRY